MDLFNTLMNCIEEDNVREEYVRAPFSYLGSKDESLDYILPELPYRKTFVDVFAGSGRVLFSRRKSELDVYNDRYSGLVAFYRCLKDRIKLDLLLEKLEFTIHSREEFIWCKKTWQSCDDDVERAYRWYYMLQCSFAGRGLYFGRSCIGKNTLHQKIYNNLKLFYPVHERLKDVLIENLDFRQCIKDFDNENTVFYLDPPYYEKNYYSVDFCKQDHISLCNIIMESKGFFALSGYKNPIYEQYKWDKVKHWKVNDRIEDGFNIEYLWIKDNSDASDS